MYRGKTIGIVIPAYNEELLISEVIQTMPDFVDRVYVIDDCSADQTYDKAASFLSDPRLKIKRHSKNQGVGAAIASGYRLALEDGMDIIAVMAGDNQMDPSQLTKLLDPIIGGTADYCKGDRMSRPELRTGMSRWRRFGNSILTRLTRISSGYRNVQDTQNGYTAISRDTLSRLEPDKIYPGYGYCNDLLTRLHVLGAIVKDVQIPARYGSENSKIRYCSFIRRVSLLIIKSFCWRIFREYIYPCFRKIGGRKND
ncbi:MAG: glycosyltransferase family 2 protein [Oscillospiraceae bacterium]|jgi:glycosyltransferase involved in cell wall biosynthesis